MYYGVIFSELHIHDAHSLKDRRQVLKSITGRLKNKYSLSATDEGEKNKWQRGTVGFAVVNSDIRILKSIIEKVRIEIENDFRIRIISFNHFTEKIECQPEEEYRD